MKSPSSLFSFQWRSNRNTNSDIEELIEHFPFACLLIDWNSQRILCANTLASEFSGYSRSQLKDIEVRKLFPGVSRQLFEESAKEDGAPVPLLHNDHTILEVITSFRDFRSRENWSLLEIISLQTWQQHEAVGQLERKRIGHLDEIFNQSDSGDLDKDLQKVVAGAGQLTGAEAMAIYRLESDKLALKCQVRTHDWFPQGMSSQDFMQLRNPHLWYRGTRPVMELHRASFSNEMAYLATMPIVDGKARIGLLVAAGRQEPPNEHLLDNMSLVARRIFSVFEINVATQSSLETIAAHEIASAFQQTILDTIQDSVITLSPDLSIRDLNHSAEISLGYSADEIKGLLIDEVLIGTETIMPALNLAQGGISSFNKQSVRLYRRSGHNFLARVSTLPVIVEGETRGIIILIQDESEKELIQAQNQQLEQRALLGEVTAVFAHEVRNPINNISTGLQLLAYNLDANDPNLEVITRLQQDCDRLADLMKSVLSFSKPTDYEMENLRLDVIVGNLVERMRPRITRAHVEPCLQISGEIPLISGNPRALEQVFTNLINNALQAMEEKGGSLTVKIKARNADSSPSYVEVAIADNGPGIARENQEKIFQPFFTTKTSGTGLGLAITKRIITAHKGTIRLNSFPGGTVFITQFPVVHSLENQENPEQA